MTNYLLLRFHFPCDKLTVNGFMQDGATKIVRVGTSAIAYAWNASESKWDQIGRHSHFYTFQSDQLMSSCIHRHGRGWTFRLSRWKSATEWDGV